MNNHMITCDVKIPNVMTCNVSEKPTSCWQIDMTNLWPFWHPVNISRFPDLMNIVSLAWVNVSYFSPLSVTLFMVQIQPWEKIKWSPWSDSCRGVLLRISYPPFSSRYSAPLIDSMHSLISGYWPKPRITQDAIYRSQVTQEEGWPKCRCSHSFLKWGSKISIGGDMEAKSKAETGGTAIQSLPHMWPIYIYSHQN